MKRILLTLISLFLLMNVYSQKEKIHYFKLTDKKFKVGSIYLELNNYFKPCHSWFCDEKELDSIVSFLTRNPRLVIEIGCHTDYRRVPMTNDTLSKRRAENAKDYLIAYGINQNRLVAIGYGSNKPLYLNKETTVESKGRDGKSPVKLITFPKGVSLSEEYIKTLKTTDEKEAACQLNRRIEIKIIGKDYKPNNNK